MNALASMAIPAVQVGAGGAPAEDPGGPPLGMPALRGPGRQPAASRERTSTRGVPRRQASDFEREELNPREPGSAKDLGGIFDDARVEGRGVLREVRASAGDVRDNRRPARYQAVRHPASDQKKPTAVMRGAGRERTHVR